MVVCKFFQQGNCRYGQSCRFEHVYGSKYSYQPNQAKQSEGSISDEQLVSLVQADVQSVLRGGQWILSSYSPFKEKPAVPGIPDISPEEARLWIYESKVNNNLDQVLSKIDELTKQAKSNYENLLNPNKTTVQMLRDLYQGQPVTSPSSSVTEPNSLFKSPVQNSTVFTQNATSAFAQMDMSKSLFSQANQSVFGNQQTAPSVFAQTTGSTSVFGQNINAPSVFSQNANVPSVFSQNANVPSAFGQNANVPSAFSQNANVPSAFSQNANVPSIFSQNANLNAPSAFGQNTNSTSVLGQPHSSFPSQDQSKSLFAQANQNAFGSQPGGAQIASIFSSVSQSPFTNAQSNQNIFQSKIDSGTNVFEQAADVGIYSNIEDLSDTDMEAFKSDKFVLGFVPELPPPKSLCIRGC